MAIYIRSASMMLLLSSFNAVASDSPDVALSSKLSSLSSKQVLEILDDTVGWYRTLATQQQASTQPSDLLILYANRQTANSVVSLAFDIARANAELLSSQENTEPNGAPASSTDKLSQENSEVNAQVDNLQKDLKRDTSQQLAMLKAKKNLLDTMSDYINHSDSKGADAKDLKAQIDALSATVPLSSAPIATAAAAPAVTNPAANQIARSGIWDLAAAALSLRGKLKTVGVIDARTAKLAQLFAADSELPGSQLKAYTAQSDALVQQARDADAAAQTALRAQFDTLAWLFKQTSGVLLPLENAQVLLKQYQRNLANWRVSIASEYHEALTKLGIRLAFLLAILFAVWVLAEIWKRTVLRFVHDARRRYQLLLIQRIVMWVAMISVVGLSVTTEITSFATFAGLLTAGLAVAMQNVLVSIVGYFFLIGKYGIRVGDRIQIGTVVGEVIDIGLVRMHLMELNSTGPLGPTGRVVAFANLIVFQATGGLFKQIPGVTLSWHESILNLPVVGDYGLLKQQLLEAVSATLLKFQAELTRQTREIERSTATTGCGDSLPQVQMSLSDAHMVAHVRYPVNREHAAEIDENVAEAVLQVISKATQGSS